MYAGDFSEGDETEAFLGLAEIWIFRNTMLPCLCAVVEMSLRKNRS